MINKWFVLAVRSIAALLLFIAVGVLISIFNPAFSPMEQESFMMNMMSAMTDSSMGSMMRVGLDDGWINFLLSFLTLIFLAIIPLSLGTGFLLRRWKVINEKE